MSKYVSFKYIKIEQPMDTFYVFKISGKLLNKMAKTDLLRYSDEEKDYIGIQRKLESFRTRKISTFIDYPNAAFPGSVILSTKSSNVSFENDMILINESNDTFNIIDGQHRISGFESSIKDFDILVSLYIDVTVNEEAELFKIINSEQKPVNSSFGFELEKYTYVKTPEKVVRDIAHLFNSSAESPLYKSIKMMGISDDFSEDKSSLSLSAFAKPIVKMIYDDSRYYYALKGELIKYQQKKKLNDNFTIKDTIDFTLYGMNYDYFANFYVNDNEFVIYQILLNYFNAIKELLPLSWKKDDSIMLKTAGYNAMMKLFAKKYKEMVIKKSLSFDAWLEELKPINKLDGKITSDNYGTSGVVAEKKLLSTFEECF